MPGQKTQAALNRVHIYQALFVHFKTFADILRSEIKPGNLFAIQIGDTKENELAFNVLHYPCKVRFGITNRDGQTLGVLSVERLLPKDERKRLLTVYFDGQGNASETITSSYYYSITLKDNLLDWFPVRVIDELFKDLESDNPSGGGVTKVKLSGV